MLSFIVIGKNEGWKISSCMQSIVDTINYNKLAECEIIYVDSNSSDDSITRVMEYDKVRIYKVLNSSNAAIARNIGAKHASGSMYFFIDGDMEIIPEALIHMYNERTGLKYPFISGDFWDYRYSVEGEIIERERYYHLPADTYQYTVGGIFLIQKQYWIEMNGMREVFRRSQDIDFGLRISREGFPLLRLRKSIAIHHTISYTDNNRIVSDILSGNWLYKGLLYKKNYRNKYLYKTYIFKEITLAVLITVIVLQLFVPSRSIFLLYIISLMVKSMYRGQKKDRMIKRITISMLADINTLISLLFFWPRKLSKVEYEEF